MVLNDLVDCFCYSQKNAGLKGLILFTFTLFHTCQFIFSIVTHFTTIVALRSFTPV